MTDIFLSIPSMNDSEYINTVRRAFDYASNPDRVFVGSSIFWNSGDIKKLSGNQAPFFYKIEKELDSIKNVKYDILPWSSFPGVGMGRIQPLKHYSGQKYYMSLDSHTFFKEGWDDIVIDLYESSEKSFGKRRLLTSYLPHFGVDYEDNDSIEKDGYRLDLKYKWPFFSYKSAIFPNVGKNFNFPVPHDRTLKPDSEFLAEDNLIDGKFLPGRKLSAHFTFTEADPWVTKYQICLDPRLIFWGEEFFQSALAYARGYEFVWPKEIFLWHMYATSAGVSIVSENGVVKQNVNNYDRSFNNEDIQFESIKEKNEFFKKYISGNSMEETITKFDLTENGIIEELFNGGMKFNYLPRTPQGFCRYSGVDLKNRDNDLWNKVPKINAVFK